MVSSYVAGITRVANIFALIVFLAEFTRCEISDITTIAEFTFIQIVNTTRLTAIVLDMLFTGTKIIISVGVCTIFGLVVKCLIMVL